MYLGTRMSFLPDDLRILESSSARLNDVCLNGIASLFVLVFSDPAFPTAHHARRCTLFTTFDLPMIRYNATDADIWRRVKRSEFWNKSIWILPIHRTRPSLHWVMCCISPFTHELFLFDSLSERSPWKREIKVGLDLRCFWFLT
jgi:hypothetical protein